MKILRINLSNQVGVLPQLVSVPCSTGLILAGIAGTAMTATASVAGQSIASSSAQQMNKEQRAWQEKEWSRQFELTNQRQDELNAEERAYNTPAAQAQRLQAAGYNPSALAAGSSMQLAQASPDTTAHSPASPQSPVVTPNDQGVAAVISSIGGLVKNLASASKDGADTTRIQALLNTEVENAVKDLQLKEIVIAGHKLEYFINTQLKDTKIMTALEHYMNLAADTYNKKLMGKQIESQVELNQSLSNLNDKLATLKGFEGLQAKILCDNFVDLINKRFAVMDSEISKNYASAGKAVAEIQTINQLRPYQTEALRLDNEIKSFQSDIIQIDRDVKVSTKQEQFNMILSNAKKLGLQNDLLEQQFKKAVEDNDWNMVEHLVGVVGSTVNSVTQLGNLSVAARRAEIQNKFVEYWNSDKFLKRNAGSVSADDSYGVSGTSYEYTAPWNGE